MKFDIVMLAEFIKNSGLNKTGMAIYFWTSLIWAKLKLPSLMGEDTFAQIALLIIIAAFAGNVLEHYIKHRYPAKEEKPNAPANPA
jgi:hypothetical protein